MSFEVTVLNRQRGRSVSTRGLAGFLQRVVREIPPRRADHMALCLVSDRKMGQLNATFRGKRGPTDVLSFADADEPDPEGRVHLGDVVVCVPTAARQARERGHSLARELKLLALHGYLHLLGHDHETDRGTMMRLQRRLERKLLRPTERTERR